ncbi:MAG: hypothetical protein L6V85_03580 [Clostridiales bacterium]|nr:MAG: hypothetical protein L6V85_03580 [Clostridiales bacterium]
MFLYRTLMPVLIGLSKIIVGVRTDKSALKGVKGPYLIVGNHTSPIDFLYFTAGVYPKPINFVVAEKYDLSQGLRRVHKVVRHD